LLDSEANLQAGLRRLTGALPGDPAAHQGVMHEGTTPEEAAHEAHIHEGHMHEEDVQEAQMHQGQMREEAGQ
jgi:hypothetical protein